MLPTKKTKAKLQKLTKFNFNRSLYSPPPAGGFFMLPAIVP